jgi:hypothetical protein
MKKIILEGTVNTGTTPPAADYNIPGDCSLTADTSYMSSHDCYAYDTGLGLACYYKSISTPPPTPSASSGTPPPTPTPTPTSGGGITMPELPDLEGLITNAWGKITSWFGSRVDETCNWMKDKFTKSDIERAQEDCYKVPFKDEESAKKALESGDIVDYYQLKDKDGKVVFLGKAWDCDNKGGTPPCFKKLSGGKYDSEKEAYIEEYFEELDDAGVYEYYCNGSVAFKPYYESDATGGYVESGRPKVWYKWDPKSGVINKA